MRISPICLLVVAACIVAWPARAGEGGTLEQARAAYRDSNFEDAVSACEGHKEIEFKLIACLSLFEKHKLYKQADDGKRARVLLDILKIDLTMAHLEMLKGYFSVPGHVEGNKIAAELFEEALKRAGSQEHCRIIVELLGEGIGDDAANVGYRALERHLENVRKYVDNGGTMPEAERELFTSEDLIGVLAEGLKGKKTKSTAQSCLVAIEEPALALLEGMEGDAAALDTVLKIKRAREKRLKKYPDGAWDSAYGRDKLPAPASE